MKISPTTTVREATPADYPALVAVGKSSYPDYAETVEEWRHWDTNWNHEKYFKLRLVAVDADRVVGYGQVNHMHWAFVPTKYRLDVTVMPRERRLGHGTALYDELVAAVGRRKGRTLGAAAKESMTDGVRFLTKRGYREVKRDWESRLFVQGFDFARFATADDRIAKQGVRVTTLADEMETDPAALQKAFELNEDSRMDIPSVDPPTHQTFDEFRRDDIDPPNALLDAFFIAVDKDGRYLGLSNLFRSTTRPFSGRASPACAGMRAARASPWRSSCARCTSPSIGASSTSRRGTTFTTSRCCRSTKRWDSLSSPPGSRTRRISSALTER